MVWCQCSPVVDQDFTLIPKLLVVRINDSSPRCPTVTATHTVRVNALGPSLQFDKVLI